MKVSQPPLGQKWAEGASVDGVPESSAMGAGQGAGQFATGAWLLIEGFTMLRRERSLWPLAMVPVTFSLLAAGAAIWLVYANAGDLYTLIDAMLPVVDVVSWYQWIWLGPAKLLLWLLSYALFLVVAGLGLAVSLVISSVAASPFLDTLSERTERLESGEVLEGGESGVGALVREGGRSIANEARRLALFLTIWALCFGAGVVIPGAHVITGPLMLGVTIFFLPLEYAGFTLDRRQVGFQDRRRWLLDNMPRMTGFGTAALASCLVPGLNLLMIPALVVAGTLLAVRYPPEGGGV